ncbi:hypothetical protein ACFW2E_46840, partial [Streptomyces sp. NPDC058964]
MSNSALRITFAVPDRGDLPDPGALSEEAREALASARQQAARAEASVPPHTTPYGPEPADRPPAPGPRVPLQPGQPLNRTPGNGGFVEGDSGVPDPAPQAPSTAASVPPVARVIADGSAAFVLVPDADGYLLPDVELEQIGAAAHLTAHLPAQVEVQQPEGERLPALLTNALTRAWSAGEHGAFLVDGRRQISLGARLPRGGG